MPTGFQNCVLCTWDSEHRPKEIPFVFINMHPSWRFQNDKFTKLEFYIKIAFFIVFVVYYINSERVRIFNFMYMWYVNAHFDTKIVLIFSLNQFLVEYTDQRLGSLNLFYLKLHNSKVFLVPFYIVQEIKQPIC